VSGSIHSGETPTSRAAIVRYQTRRKSASPNAARGAMRPIRMAEGLSTRTNSQAVATSTPTNVPNERICPSVRASVHTKTRAA
jgi:hypothetical protein